MTDVFLVVFAVSSRTSFWNVTEKWIPEVRHQCPGTPVVLVAAKVDLRDDDCGGGCGDTAMVTREEGEVLAREIGAAAYRECSAKLQRGLNEVFAAAVRATRPPEGEQESGREGAGAAHRRKHTCAVM
eukprot:TRINITY_DN3225_c0_g2_i1.p2 TRINITY_DN3225_c0_g2~~TRINITY_DN3225_c0_g2_i1.p2  ORF type:complete len:140 (+),score=28.05 TRINITY_DN3225_c0_g2_i1:38-421(+)